MRKRILSILIAVVMLISVLPTFSAAAAGNYSGGDGSISSPYKISTLADLNALAKTVNDGTDLMSGKYFKLTADISGFSTPIKWFYGHFDGSGHKITLNITLADNQSISGLFETIYKGAEIKNLIVDGTIKGKATNDDVGGIVGYNSGGTVIGCVNKVTISGCRNCIGGICGENGGIIKACCNLADLSITNDAKMVGGICGQNTGQIIACTNSGSLKSSSNSIYIESIGGICGKTMQSGSSSCIIDSCRNLGSISLQSAAYRVGGIVGLTGLVKMSNCINMGEISTSFKNTVKTNTTGYIGGLLGYAEGTLNLYNSESISSINCAGKSGTTMNIGGLAGYLSSYVELANCYSVRTGNAITNTNNCGAALGGCSCNQLTSSNLFYNASSGISNAIGYKHENNNPTLSSLSDEKMKASSGADALITKLNGYGSGAFPSGWLKWCITDGEYPHLPSYVETDSFITGSGTVSVADTDGNNSKYNVANYFDVGEPVEITTTAGDGYCLDSVSVMDINHNQITVKDNTFTMPATPVIVMASFVPHTHNFVYEKDENANIITATCIGEGGCGYSETAHPAVLAVTIGSISYADPTDPVQLGWTNKTDNSVSCEVSYYGMACDLSIYGPSAVKPTKCGSYTATVSCGSISISESFSIRRLTISEVNLDSTQYCFDEAEKAPAITSVKAGTVIVPESEYTVSGAVTGSALGEYTITVTGKDNNFTGSTSITWKIIKTPAVIELPPTCTDLVYGQPLSESTFIGGMVNMDGTFSWKNPDTYPIAGLGAMYDVVFTPDDTENYSASECRIAVNIEKAAPVTPASVTATAPTSENGEDGKITVSGINTELFTLEYSPVTEPAIWADVTGSAITGLKTGDSFYIRVKATVNNEASGIAEITVPQYTSPISYPIIIVDTAEDISPEVEKEDKKEEDKKEGYTVPVEGEATISADVEITDGNAAVKEITKEQLEAISTPKVGTEGVTDSIVIDLSEAKQEVTGVELTKKTVENLADVVNDDTNKIDTVTVELGESTVELDAKTLETLQESMTGDNLKLVVDKTEEKSLNEKQKNALSEYNVNRTFEAYFESNGEKIHDFKGGTAKVSVKFTPEKGKKAEDYKVYYINEEGKLQKHTTKYENGKLTFITSHFSDYAIIYDNVQDVLLAQVAVTKKNYVKLFWNQIEGAEKYVVYGAKCSKKYTVLTETDGNTYTVKEIGDVTLISGKSYKFYVVAYDAFGNKIKSKPIHLAVNNVAENYSNVKDITALQDSLTLTVGDKAVVGAEYATYEDMPHISTKHGQSLRYTSDCPDIAKVAKDGTVTAKSEGTANIYIQDIGGKWCVVEVTVEEK